MQKGSSVIYYYFVLGHVDEDGVRDEEGFVFGVMGTREEAEFRAQEYEGKVLKRPYRVRDESEYEAEENAFYRAMYEDETIYQNVIGGYGLTDKGKRVLI